jgi:dUTP pyrophosphatase
MTQINVKILENGAGLELPKYATAQSAGADLLAAIDENVVLKAGEWALVPTGIAIALPANFEAQVRPRSGLAAKNGVTVLNTPGTIDADYRGEVKVILINHSKQDFVVERGMRIAQVIFAPVVQGQWNVVEDLEATARGEGGFGSTGTSSNAA